MPSTNRVKNLDEAFVHIVRSGFNSKQGMGQIVTITGATTAVQKLGVERGAGETGIETLYAVALTSVNGVTDFSIDGNALDSAFAVGDPPGTIRSIASGDIAAAITAITGGVSGDQFGIFKRPPAYSSGLIPYVTAKSSEPLPGKRDIRDRGALTDRKKMAQQGGVLNLTARHENANAGLSKFVDQDILVILEREDNRAGVVNETEIYYGSYIHALPGPNESEGDTDTDVTVAIPYETIAVLPGT